MKNSVVGKVCDEPMFPLLWVTLLKAGLQSNDSRDQFVPPWFMSVSFFMFLNMPAQVCVCVCEYIRSMNTPQSFNVHVCQTRVE